MRDLAACHAAQGRVDEVVDRGRGVFHAALPGEAPRQGEGARPPEPVPVGSGRVEVETAMVGVRGLVHAEVIAIVFEARPEVLPDGGPRDESGLVFVDVTVEAPGQDLQEDDFPRGPKKTPGSRRHRRRVLFVGAEGIGGQEKTLAVSEQTARGLGFSFPSLTGFDRQREKNCARQQEHAPEAAENWKTRRHFPATCENRATPPSLPAPRTAPVSP